MRRTSLILAGALACLVLCLAGTAAAKAAPKTCTTSSKNVIGRTVTGALVATNVDPSQKEFATCAYAKKVMNGLTSLRIEEPKSVKGFYCVPTVLATSPDVVKYKCTLKGADTATFVKLTFQVKYDLD